jgi:Na+/H+ antiporter NhaC
LSELFATTNIQTNYTDSSFVDKKKIRMYAILLLTIFVNEFFFLNIHHHPAFHEPVQKTAIFAAASKQFPIVTAPRLLIQKANKQQEDMRHVP